ncbi:MAG: DUF885 family protein [Gemmatimonadota bacterium]
MMRYLVCACCVAYLPLASQAPDSTIPDLDALRRQPVSELATAISRWSSDRGALLRRYDAEFSPVRRARMRRLDSGWMTALGALPFGQLGRDAQVDAILLRIKLRHELDLLDREERQAHEMTMLLPFADTLWQILEQRRTLERPDPILTSRRLAWMADTLAGTRAAFERELAAGRTPVSRSVALRSTDVVGSLRRDLNAWWKFYDGYDPELTWRLSEPADRLLKGIDGWQSFLRERVVGIKAGADEPIVGDPIGRSGLVADLANEMIPYTPEELLTIAEKEFAFLESEARRAAGDMGLGDDWKAALERTKQDYPPVGGQVPAVRDMAYEAIDYVMSHDLITVPPLAREVWRMEMMSAEAQKVNPFFLGGESIIVASPTEGQTEAEKQMALRANNRHFSRATVFHELIPGHELQGFMASRSNSYRGLFSTPFYVEGWSLWWEMHLWDLGFPKTPENRMGMLFWRMHRAARIIFSLNFHLGKWTPEQCIDFLVDRVGHERASATGEVRRSFNGSYSPLYQAGYLLGGMQLRALYKEMVTSGRMTERAFHDAVLSAGPMPIEMVRALLDSRVQLRADYVPQWRFAD